MRAAAYSCVFLILYSFVKDSIASVALRSVMNVPVPIPVSLPNAWCSPMTVHGFTYPGIILTAAGMEEPVRLVAPVGYGGRKEACMLPISPAASTMRGGAA